MIDLTKNARVIVQGITGHQGGRHALEMRTFGTNVVGGVTPGKGGERVSEIPVFDTVREAVEKEGANCSAIFVPSSHCLEAAMESMDAGIEMLVAVTEHVPIHDAMKMKRRAETLGITLIGPNSPGLTIPSSLKIGIMPNHIFKEGRVAVLSRSGTLTYEIVNALTIAGIGQSTVVGIGGDPVVGSSMARISDELLRNDEPDCIVLVGEIGGFEEQRAAESIGRWYDGPVIAYIAGRTAPQGKRMGHAGAIIGDSSESYPEKVSSLRSLGVCICEHMSDVSPAVKNALY
jgi:succinyl-CoA synthetase alpha subunit